MMRFDGKVALVVGAAQGIGKATAIRLASEGAVVVAIDRAAPEVTEAAAEIGAAGGKAEAVIADALDEGEAKRIVADTLARHGRIDILVNAVGGSTIIDNSTRHLDALELSEWKSLIDFNLVPIFLYAHAVIPAMKRQKFGKIVFVSSYGRHGRGIGWNAPYVTAKAGIAALTQKLAIELGPFGITCNTTAPGRVITERVRKRLANLGGAAPGQDMSRVPLQRESTAEDQANVICFLVSSDADYVTGVTIDVTGGRW